jgi:tripartite-type tricarboxylate transporter receptor subunit TctC
MTAYKKRRTLARMGAGLLTALLGATGAAQAQTQAQAQTFPDRPIRVVVPFAPGNTLDQALRVVSEQIKKNTGQPLVVDNKPGGSGLIAIQAVLAAPADGYTVLLSNIGMFGINPHTFSKLPYDPQKSFRHVTGFVGASMALAVHASVPANNLREFIDWARPKGNAVSYASWTAGNSSHFAGVILNQKAGLQMLHVPFNGTPPALQNLVGGQVQAAFLPPLALKQHADGGKVKVLAVTSPQRSPLFPQVGTFREQGYPDLEIHIWSGLAVPAQTPDAIVNRLHAEFEKALVSPEVREKFRAFDFEALPLSPDEFTRFVQRDNQRWAEAVRLSGFKASE